MSWEGVCLCVKCNCGAIQEFSDLKEPSNPILYLFSLYH